VRAKRDRVVIPLATLKTEFFPAFDKAVAARRELLNPEQ
jgi:hypothetical protein